MVNWPAVFSVFSVYCAGVVIPGPNFVAVARKAVSTTTIHTLVLVAGIVNLFWATCAILGIGAVFALLPWLAMIVKCIGAGYLIWFGARLIIASGKASVIKSGNYQTITLKEAFAQGVGTNIANPKSVAFYAAIFSASAPSHVEIATFIAMLAMVGIVASLWYGTVAIVLSRSYIAGAYARQKKHIDRVCGALIIFLGIKQLIR